MTQSDGGGVAQPDGTPGSENSPKTGEGAPASTADRGTAGVAPPPGANQPGDEPVSSSPDASPQSSSPDDDAATAAAAGSVSRAAGEQGEAPRAMQVDDVRGAANMAQSTTMPATATGGIPTPGDSAGVSVPAVQATRGTSEEAEPVDGVRLTALAPPGKPDGEVDTRG